MGIFSSKKKEETAAKPTRRDLQKALFVIGCAMCMADGDADDKEINKMQSVAARMPLFANNTTDEDTAVMHEAGAAYDADVKGAINWAIGILQYENWRAVAFCFLCEIIMADGEVDESEMNVLNGLSGDLGVKVDEGQAIFDTFKVYYQPYMGLRTWKLFSSLLVLSSPLQLLVSQLGWPWGLFVPSEKNMTTASSIWPWLPSSFRC